MFLLITAAAAIISELISNCELFIDDAVEDEEDDEHEEDDDFLFKIKSSSLPELVNNFNLAAAA